MNEGMREFKKLKTDAITAVHLERGSSGGRAMLFLLDMLILEIRVSNDHAAPEELKSNQGAISAYKHLQGYITNGVPVRNEQSEEDLK
jgi:hypothetical protein